MEGDGEEEVEACEFFSGFILVGGEIAVFSYIFSSISIDSFALSPPLPTQRTLSTPPVAYAPRRCGIARGGRCGKED